ncbi:hypothetical protein [uncultured Desulfosarcina sp.]|uniref:hypothetical protein n=1 Tax=uncultured Desulfosarcina sp. TaxID=218289 RepID=UPI0029C7CFE4|nr:hypothetical protein [uncultured Desulfosarcina sp.]
MTGDNGLLCPAGVAELPYSERQLIVIVPDDVKKTELEAMQKARQEESKDKSISWWNSAIDAIALIAPRITVYGLGVEFVVGIYKGIQKLRQKEINIRTVSYSDANGLVFPPGHPQKKCVYVGSPVDPLHYFSLADFHRMTLESKFTEIVNILMALGAETIQAERVIGWGAEITANAKVLSADDCGASTSRTNTTEKSFLFEANLNPEGNPQMPEKVAWYPFEPTWQMISQGRLHHGLRNFALNVTYQENYGITTDLNASVKGEGLSIGGQFTEHQSTIWKITGQFSEQGVKKPDDHTTAPTKHS